MRNFVRYRLLVFGLLTLLVATSFKPTDNYTIVIKVSSAWDEGPQGGSFYTISGNKRQLTIDHIQIDSLYFLKIHSDRYAPKGNLSQPMENEFYLKKRDSVAKYYHNNHYHQKVLIYAERQPRYFKQIDSLLHTPLPVLLRRSSKYPIYYDAATFNFNITAGRVKRKFEAYSPDENFGPVVAHFLRNTDTLLSAAKK